MSSSVSLVTGVALIVIGIGALTAAPITSQLILLPIGLVATLFGAVRLWLYQRGR